MHHRVDLQPSHHRVGRLIPVRVEVDVRLASLPPAVATEMLDRIELRFVHVGAVDQVVVGIDQPGRSDDAGIGKRLAALAQHVVEIVLERVVA